MKSIRILPLLLALVLLCTGCAAGGAAEPTPAPDMSDLPLDGGYAYLRVEVLSRDKDAKTLEVKVLDFGDADGVNVGRSEERRVGKECNQVCRSRWSPYH